MSIHLRSTSTTNLKPFLFAQTQPPTQRLPCGGSIYNRKYFYPAVASGDLKAASLWCSNIGRSLSLGDFVAKNLARAPVKGSIMETNSLLGCSALLWMPRVKSPRLPATKTPCFYVVPVLPMKPSSIGVSRRGEGPHGPHPAQLRTLKPLIWLPRSGPHGLQYS